MFVAKLLFVTFIISVVCLITASFMLTGRVPVDLYFGDTLLIDRIDNLPEGKWMELRVEQSRGPRIFADLHQSGYIVRMHLGAAHRHIPLMRMDSVGKKFVVISSLHQDRLLGVVDCQNGSWWGFGADGGSLKAHGKGIVEARKDFAEAFEVYRHAAIPRSGILRPGWDD